MSVKIEEYVSVTDAEGVEKEGKAVATNLVAVENPEGGFFYGVLKQITKTHTIITCDNDKCEKGTVDENFHTHPKTLEFDDNGNGPGEFLKEVSEVIVVSDFTGRKLVFCCLDCLTSYSKSTLKKARVVAMPSGKGTRTFDPEPVLKENDGDGTRESEKSTQPVAAGT